MEVYDSKRAADAIGIKPRTLTEWAAKGRIRFETVQRGCVQKRFYNGEDVERLRIENQTAVVVPKPSSETGVVLAAKSPQEVRGLDMVAIVGNQAIGYKGAIEAVAMQFKGAVESVAAQLVRQNEIFFAHLKAEADANRERLDAEREDSMKRFLITEKRLEAEREERMARLKMRKGGAPEPDKEPEPPQKVNGKAKGARA